MPTPIPLPLEFVEALAHAGPRLGGFGREIVWYADVTSTNDVASSMADAGASEGCVVGANAQSAGRGRHGRTWASPPGSGLYVSVVLRPPARAAVLLTIAAGVAVAEGVQAATGLSPDLKWPNDLLVTGRKVAGVLAEASVGAALEYVILGVGVNVMPAAYPPDVVSRATSLEVELGRSVDRGLLFAECLGALHLRYAELKRGTAAGVLRAWRLRAAATMGRRVRWNGSTTTVEGVAEGIDQDGALIVRAAAGSLRVTSGEVIWL